MFNHAERNCVIHAAHLISIESKEENKKIVSFVQNYIGKPGKVRIWLGMERLTSDSSLHWVDNKPINFVNWAPGEPDQTGACVQMIQKGWWEDSSCLQNLSYICKKGKCILKKFFLKDSEIAIETPNWGVRLCDNMRKLSFSFYLFRLYFFCLLII